MKYLGTKQLETERLILRKIKLEDASIAYDNWCSNERVAKYTLWKKHKNVDETINLFKMWIDEYDDPKTFRWIVELKENHDLIGTIDVPSKKYLDYGTVEIGYCYSEKHWNKGYGTEALKAVMKYLFLECDADIIFASYLEQNPASGKVMQKSGMIYEGKLRGRILDKEGVRNNLLYYSITKEEYFEKQIEEYLQVFDKNKKVLNKKVPRSNKLDLKDGDHFMIVVIFIENSEGKFLLQKTSSKRNSCIATTGGHVTFGDDGFKTALKEVKEELGLTLKKDEINYVKTLDYKNAFLEIYYVKKDIDKTSLVLQDDEVDSVDWYTIDEINKLIEQNKIRKGNIEPFNEILKYKEKL